MMNAIFCAKADRVAVDACLLGVGESAYLQQACALTGGTYLRPRRPAALLQYLLAVFVVDLSSRAALRLPTPRGVDFRASCFCHKAPVDVGYVCSVCLSIYCSECAACSTCGADYNDERAEAA
jgi:transcription initiation factor TFIIH subunit 3